MTMVPLINKLHITHFAILFDLFFRKYRTAKHCSEVQRLVKAEKATSLRLITELNELARVIFKNCVNKPTTPTRNYSKTVKSVIPH
jgi:hypothetical protein